MLARLRFIPSIPRHKLPDRPQAGIADWPKVKTSKGPTIQPWAPGTQGASTSAQHPSPGAAVARAFDGVAAENFARQRYSAFALLPLLQALNQPSNVRPCVHVSVSE